LRTSVEAFSLYASPLGPESHRRRSLHAPSKTHLASGGPRRAPSPIELWMMGNLQTEQELEATELSNAEHVTEQALIEEARQRQRRHRVRVGWVLLAGSVALALAVVIVDGRGTVPRGGRAPQHCRRGRQPPRFHAASRLHYQSRGRGMVV
jgi:hypothetical protein